MPRPISLKTLTLSLDTEQVECQLTRAAIVDTPDTEDLTTFCGTVTSSHPRYTMELGGFQDWGGDPDGTPVIESVCDMLHTSYMSYQDDAVADAPIAAVLQVGTKTRTCDIKPQADPTFGGDAGAALTLDVTCDVVGDITEGTATP